MHFDFILQQVIVIYIEMLFHRKSGLHMLMHFDFILQQVIVIYIEMLFHRKSGLHS